MAGQGGRRGVRRVLSTLLLGALTLLAGAPAAARAQIAVGDVSASEAAGSLTFTLTRQAGTLAPSATVAFATVDGSATSPADFTAASGRRTFPGTLFAETQTQQVTIAVARDALDEIDERFALAVSGAGVSDGEGVGTVVDDDPPPAVGVLDAPPALEGATALFRIGLTRASGRAVSVAFATADGSASAGQDYGARDGRITIAAGATSASVGVPLIDDGADEPDERFELRVSAPRAATLADAAGAATIVDNDEPAAAPPPAPAPGPAPGPAGVAQPPPAAGPSAGPVLPQLGVSRPRLRQPATVLVTLACPRQSGRCRGRMTIFSRPSRRSRIRALRRERRLGRRNFNLSGASTHTLRIALSRRDRVLLRRAGRMSVRAYVVMTDSAGRTGVRRVNGTLVARTSHSG